MEEPRIFKIQCKLCSCTKKAIHGVHIKTCPSLIVMQQTIQNWWHDNKLYDLLICKMGLRFWVWTGIVCIVGCSFLCQEFKRYYLAIVCHQMGLVCPHYFSCWDGHMTVVSGHHQVPEKYVSGCILYISLPTDFIMNPSKEITDQQVLSNSK